MPERVCVLLVRVLDRVWVRVLDRVWDRAWDRKVWPSLSLCHACTLPRNRIIRRFPLRAPVVGMNGRRTTDLRRVRRIANTPRRML